MRALLFLSALTLTAAEPWMPTVPGAVNPKVTQANIKTTVCRAGYTATIRPSEAYTNKLKVAQMAKLKLPGKPSDFEEDHEISLEIGGAPKDPANLWPQPYDGGYGARRKDQVEDELHRRLCAGKMTLVEVQTCIRTDWVACGRRLGVIQ